MTTTKKIPKFVQILSVTVLVTFIAFPCRAQTTASEAGPSIAEPAAESTAGADVDVTTESWREQYAYTLGMQAYIFGFPYTYNPTLRWQWVTVPPPEGSIQPYAPINHFTHVRRLVDATYRDGGSPNNDTLYSVAWLDVSEEPVILSHPDMRDRYFTFEIASMDSDNFAYVGKRVTGGKAGNFAIIGPKWSGDLPSGVKPLPVSRTNSVFVLGRTQVDGPEDVAAVNALQDQYRLVPLSYWGKTGVDLPARRDVWQPHDAKSDPLAPWKTMNRTMTEDPPEARLAPLMDLFASIHVGPSQDVETLDDASKKGLERAAADGLKLLQEVSNSGALGTEVNNWSIPPLAIGRAGLDNDFLLRAALQSLGGIVYNDPEEAVYFNTTKDVDGRTLDGTHRYALHFNPGELPKVNAFWSITVYDPTHNLPANPIDRYSIGDRTAGLVADPDGGLTIYLQATSPGANKEPNWLPTPKSGKYQLLFRTYLPSPEITSGKWAPPGIQPVE